MTTISVDTDNVNEIEEIKALAKEKGWQVVYTKSAMKELKEKMEAFYANGGKNKAIDVLSKVAGMGGFQSFGDPDEWLKETRTDKPLFGRE
ncbi:MAG: hypothetical protein ABIX01_12680 [Chitinophagaceae bacterium]